MLTRSYSKIVLFSALSALVLFIIARAALLDVTHDEAFSFYNMKFFWYAQALCTGNTHWLNSMAMKISIWLGGEHTLQFRWLTISSFVAYAIVVYYWIRTIPSSVIKVLAFSTALLHPYLLDYFAIGRGYASGVAFESLSILFFIKALQQDKRLYRFVCILCAALSAMGNFGFVYFFVIMAAVYFFKFYFLHKKGFLKEKGFYTDVAITVFFFTVVVLAFRFIMRCSSDVVGAGEDSFAAIFYAFVDAFNYYKFPLPAVNLHAYSFVFALCLGLCVFAGVFRFKKHNNTIYFYGALILLLIITLSVMNHVLFGLVYPFYRTIIFLFPLVALNLTYGFDHFLKHKLAKLLVCSAFSLVIILNFIFSINFKYTFDYKDQADTIDCFTELKKLGAKNVGISPELFGAFYNYYNVTKVYPKAYKGERIETLTPQGICSQPNQLKKYDHILLYPPYDLSYYKNSPVKLEAVYVSVTTKNIILKVN